MSDKKLPPFFVGYLPMPAALKKFYLPFAIVLIAACGALGYSIAAQQKSAGTAHWDNAAVEMRGVLTLDPYPVLHRLNPNNASEIESILVVAQGKHAAVELLAGFANQSVSLNGYPIRRGGWTMLEITGADSAAKTDDANAAAINASLNIKPLGEIVLRGEIVDSKCYLGVMKPGDGKIHKACAEVCLLGGMPPMLVAEHDGGQKFGYLLMRPDGSAASEWLAKFAAETVQLSGQLQQQGDLLFIRMHDDGIRRM